MNYNRTHRDLTEIALAFLPSFFNSYQHIHTAERERERETMIFNLCELAMHGYNRGNIRINMHSARFFFFSAYGWCVDGKNLISSCIKLCGNIIIEERAQSATCTPDPKICSCFIFLRCWCQNQNNQPTLRTLRWAAATACRLHLVVVFVIFFLFFLSIYKYSSIFSLKLTHNIVVLQHIRA